ncbi:MAG: hypothetical protein WD624_02045, partial [Rhodospirillales bacterium]
MSFRNLFSSRDGHCVDNVGMQAAFYSAHFHRRHVQELTALPARQKLVSDAGDAAGTRSCPKF